MRFKLYKSEVIGQDGITRFHVVAPCIEAVADVIKDRYDARGVRLTKIDTRQVDETLGPRRQLGLDELLTSAPTGLARYIPKVGWLVYEQAKRKLRLFKIDELDGGQIFIVAPDANVASAVWATSLKLGPDEQRSYSITEVIEREDDKNHRGLDDLLAFGPVGQVTWSDERGWSAA